MKISNTQLRLRLYKWIKGKNKEAAALSSKSMAAQKLILHLLPLLLVFSTTVRTSSGGGTPVQSFIQCFTNRTHSPNLLSIPNTPLFNSVLLSSFQNQRSLLSPETSKPSLIVSASHESHVQSTVSCARSSNLRLRTRSGGHDYEGMSYTGAKSVPGGDSPFVALDISALRSISFDETLETAWVQAGATVGELYYAVGKKSPNLAFPAGICPTIGLGGHFTGGGIGPLTRKFGLAADNIVDALVVDARGRILDRRSMGEDLFWAIRGAGSAGFGVIVAFKILLLPIRPVVTTFNVVKTLRQNATALVARWEKIAHKFDPNLFVRVIAQPSKESDGTETIQIVFNSFYLGRREELLAAARRSFPELGLTASDCTERSWLESTLFFNGDNGKPTETLLDRTPATNSSFKGKSDFVKVPIGVIGLEKIWRFMMEAAAEESIVLIMEPFGGKMSEIREDEIAFPHRKGNLYNIQYFMRWFDEAATEKHLGWMRKLYAFMAPYVSGKPRAAYYNYKDLDLGRNVEGKETSYSAARVWGEKYFKGNFERLAAVKSRVDPGNFFWNEQSVPLLKPAARASEHDGA